jgi:hypothetical protein
MITQPHLQVFFSFFFVCYLCMKREAGGQGEFSGEFSVGLATRRDVVSQPAT